MLKSASTGSGPSTTHVGIAHAQHRGLDRLAQHFYALAAQLSGRAHRGPERIARPGLRQQLERLDAGARVHGDRGPVLEALHARDQRGQAAEAVAESSDQLPSAFRSRIVAPRSRNV
jgi:hypothetical protein